MLCGQPSLRQLFYDLGTIINYVFAHRKTVSPFFTRGYCAKNTRAKPQMLTLHAFGRAYALRSGNSIFFGPGREVTVLLAWQLCTSPAALLTTQKCLAQSGIATQQCPSSWVLVGVLHLLLHGALCLTYPTETDPPVESRALKITGLGKLLAYQPTHQFTDDWNSQIRLPDRQFHYLALVHLPNLEIARQTSPINLFGRLCAAFVILFVQL